MDGFRHTIMGVVAECIVEAAAITAFLSAVVIWIKGLAA